MVFGGLLIVLSAVAYAELHFWHTFIPGAFGVLLVVFGLLANTEDAKKRMIFMHIAVTVGLLGFLGTIPGIVGVIQMAAGHVVVRPDAAKVQAAMGAICFVFVALCVRSFIAARRARVTA
jgi:hypothetical protein